MIRSDVTLIDPVADPHLRFVMFTASGKRAYLIQTWKGSSRHEASLNNVVGYRFIDQLPEMKKIQQLALAQMIFDQPECWDWSPAGPLVLQGMSCIISGAALLEVVDGPNSEQHGLIKLGEQAFFHGRTSVKKMDIWLQTSPITVIFSSEPITR